MFFSVHDPYLPPAPYNRMYDPEYRGSIIDSRAKLKKIHRWRKSHKVFWDSVDKTDTRDVAFLKSLYDGAIKHMDERRIRPMIDELKALGIYENSLLVFTSDHGEAFNEHNHFLHNDLYKETLHVPLIMVYPVKLPKNRKVKQLVRLIDIMPTIFDLVGIRTDIAMQGTSFLPSVRGEEFSVDCYSTRAYDWLVSLRTNQYSYIIQNLGTTTVEEIYDRKKDPNETSNIIKDGTVPLEMLRKKIERITNANRKFKNKLGQSFNRSEHVLPDRETVEKLESLGYLQ